MVPEYSFGGERPVTTYTFSQVKNVGNDYLRDLSTLGSWLPVVESSTEQSFDASYDPPSPCTAQAMFRVIRTPWSSFDPTIQSV